MVNSINNLSKLNPSTPQSSASTTSSPSLLEMKLPEGVHSLGNILYSFISFHFIILLSISSIYR
jgi:hypothetical protein